MSKKPYHDFAGRNGSKTDYSTVVCTAIGVAALITVLLYAGVIADALISLIELV